jgi:hypothetical protein
VTAVLLVLVNPPPDPSSLPPSEIASVVEDLEVVMSGEEILDLAMESEFYDCLAEVHPDAGLPFDQAGWETQPFTALASVGDGGDALLVSGPGRGGAGPQAASRR